MILIALASCMTLVRFNYDDRKQLGPDTESNVGYAALEKHFPVNQTIPEYLFIQSPDDLRTPRALADLEMMVAAGQPAARHRQGAGRHQADRGVAGAGQRVVSGG